VLSSSRFTCQSEGDNAGGGILAVTLRDGRLRCGSKSILSSKLRFVRCLAWPIADDRTNSASPENTQRPLIEAHQCGGQLAIISKNASYLPLEPAVRPEGIEDAR
jgi:hypothetical protein